MDKKATITTLIILLIYFAFTSGLVFEATKCDKVNDLEIPYSIALSNTRVGLIGVYNDDDINCVKWLLENTEPDIPVHVDYYGTSLILDYSDIGRNTYTEPEIRHYTFLTTWNIENQKMAYGWFEGRRSYGELPDLSNAKEVYRQGNAVIYEVGG